MVTLCTSGVGKLEAAEAQREALLNELTAAGLSAAAVLEAFQAREARQQATAASSLPDNPHVRLAAALLCSAVSVGDPLGQSVPSILYSSGRGKAPVGSLRVPGSNTALAAFKREIANLKAKQPAEEDWGPQGNSFKIAVSALRASKRAILRVEIERIQKEYIWFDTQFTRVGNGLSQERSKKLRVTKAAREKQLRTLLSILSGWERGGFAGLADQSSFNAQTVSTEELRAGLLPWFSEFGSRGPFAPLDPRGGSEASRNVLTVGKEALGCVSRGENPRNLCGYHDLFAPRDSLAESSVCSESERSGCNQWTPPLLLRSLSACRPRPPPPPHYVRPFARVALLGASYATWTCSSHERRRKSSCAVLMTWQVSNANTSSGSPRWRPPFVLSGPR